MWALPFMLSTTDMLQIRYGHETPARKVVTDRGLLFDVLLPPFDVEFRRRIEEEHRRCCEFWFDWMNSPTDYQGKHGLFDHSWKL